MYAQVNKHSVTYALLVKIGRLGGGGSDYKAFVQHIGVPAADITFGKGNNMHIVPSDTSIYYVRSRTGLQVYHMFEL